VTCSRTWQFSTEFTGEMYKNN